MNLAGKTLLIVDDEEMLREVMVDLFRAEGATTLEAGNGIDALGIVVTNKIDAVVTDVRMPRGGGIALIKAIHKLDSNITLPLIFVCSGFNDLTEKEVTDLGIAAVFPKPFDGEALRKEVLNHFRRGAKLRST